MKLESLIAVATTFALLTGCSSDAPDIHAMPRETKAYESAPVESMSADALVAHLKLLSEEMTTATQNSAFVELHHIEIALTRALNALEPAAPSEAKPTIDTLKTLAVKIHSAGHDQNGSMAAKLDTTLKQQIDRLATFVSQP